MRSRNLLPVTIAVAALGVALAFAPMAGAASSGATPMIHTTHPGAIPAKPHHQCYSLTKQSSGASIASASYPHDPQNAAAAIFSIAKPCTISEVDVSGQYYLGTPEAKSETVTFYDNTGTDPNGHSAPGNVVGTPQTVTGADNAGNFQIPLKPYVKLIPGTYWVSVVANMSRSRGFWYWQTSNMHKGQESDWSNPAGGDGVCQTWDTISHCLGAGNGYSMMVQLVRHFNH